MKFIEYSDQEEMMISLANLLAGQIVQALNTQDYVTFVVPGGTTPAPVFDCLSNVDLDWPRVNILLSDERWVPQSSPRSNTRLLRQRLFVGKATEAGSLPLFADTPDPDTVIDVLARAIEPRLPIGILLLGMGEDMHTASLFPGADQLAAALAPDAPTLMSMRAPGAEEPRVTLTARVLAAALDKHVLITGPEKRAALERAQEIADPMSAPILAVLDDATNVHWAP